MPSCIQEHVQIYENMCFTLENINPNGVLDRAHQKRHDRMSVHGFDSRQFHFQMRPKDSWPQLDTENHARADQKRHDRMSVYDFDS